MLVLFLHGCASMYSVVEFEVLDPATVSFPDNVQQLLVLNRAPVTRQVFEAEDIDGLSDEQILMVDTAIVNNLSRGMLQVLQNSPLERFHHPLWLSSRLRDTSGLANMALTRREVEDLCRENNCDAIIALEYYSLDLDVYIEQEGSYAYPHTKYYEVATDVRWSIYLPGRPRAFDNYTLIDTVYFTEILDGILVHPQTSSSMLRESAMRSGIKYGRYLVPAWNQTGRVIYKGKGKVLREAAGYTDQGDWEQAYDIWLELARGGDSTLAAKAYHNMAVYFELEDNIDSACALVKTALRYDSLEAVQNYKDELETRIGNREEILKQVW